MVLVFMFFLLIVSSLPVEVEGSGSGDYPPPSDGDWDVYNDTVVENETIVLNGNLTVYDGASLTFRNVTLVMNSSSSLEFYIEVLSGGSFYIYDLDWDNTSTEDASVLKRNDPSFPYFFRAYNGSILEMRNSNLQGCGADTSVPEYAGLYVNTDNAIIDYNNISNNNYGVVCWDSDAMISNNTIVDNAKAGVFATVWSNGTIINNRFVGNTDHGVRVNGWDNTPPRPSFPLVSNNYIEGGDIGIQINFYSIPIIRDNTIIDSKEDGIYCGQWCEVTIRNTSIDGGNYGIVGSEARDITIINSSVKGTNFYDLSANSRSFFEVINTTFSTSECYNDPSNITVKWYLHTRVEDQIGEPIPGATVMVMNATSVEKYNKTTDSNGWVKWMTVTEYVDQNVSGSTVRTHHTPHEVEVSYDGFTFSNNPRDVDMDTTKTEIFVADQSVPEFPVLIVPVLFVLLINIGRRFL